MAIPLLFAAPLLSLEIALAVKGPAGVYTKVALPYPVILIVVTTSLLPPYPQQHAQVGPSSRACYIYMPSCVDCRLACYAVTVLVLNTCLTSTPLCIGTCSYVQGY